MDFCTAASDIANQDVGSLGAATIAHVGVADLNDDAAIHTLVRAEARDSNDD